MDGKQQFKLHNLSRRNNSIIILLLLAFNLLILILSSNSWNADSEAASCAVCNSKEHKIYRIMCEVPDGEGFELPPEWTVADLIREAVRKNRHSSHPLQKDEIICRNVRKVRVRAFPFLRRRRVEVDASYLVFPAPASAVFDKSLQQPVPILMCPPNAHGKFGSIILYSDGSTKPLTPEEAERLVAEHHPKPIKFQVDSTAERDMTEAADRQN